MKVLFTSLILIVPASAQVLGGAESFTSRENGESWWSYDGLTGTFDIAIWSESPPDEAEINAFFNRDGWVSLIATSSSSSGFFVGDYTSQGIDTVKFDFFVEDRTSFSHAEIYILVGETFYYSEPLLAEGSEWTTAKVSFTRDQWSIYDLGVYIPEELTPDLLENVLEIGVDFVSLGNAAHGKKVSLDNFFLLPDLSPPDLSIESTTENATLTFTGIPGLEYTLQSSNSLEDDSWTNIGTPFIITGSSKTNIPLSGRSFFRVLLDGILIDAP